MRFERFYEALTKRQIYDELTQRKLGMINALYSNSNYDGENAKIRDQVIEQLEEQFSNAMSSLYGGVNPEDDVIDKDNPFFQAMERGLKNQGVPSLDEIKETEEEKFLKPVPEVDQE